MIAQQISHYHVVRELGKGGMREVYLAQDTKLDRSVALKILPSGLVTDQERVIQRSTKDLEAYELYLQGRYAFYQYDRTGIERAIALFRKALARDPKLALAHAGLSLCYAQYMNFSWDPSPVWLDRALIYMIAPDSFPDPQPNQSLS